MLKVPKNLKENETRSQKESMNVLGERSRAGGIYEVGCQPKTPVGFIEKVKCISMSESHVCGEKRSFPLNGIFVV